MIIEKLGNKMFKVMLSTKQHENLEAIGKVDGLVETETLSVIVIMGINFAMKNLVNKE